MDTTGRRGDTRRRHDADHPRLRDRPARQHGAARHGRRPPHALASLAFRDGKPWQVLGCMGADGQPQIHLQAYVGLIDSGLSAQQAVEAPRWLSGRFGLGEVRDLLHIEARFAPATIAELERRGHKVQRLPERDEMAGHAHCITIDPESGLHLGGADPCSDGAAIGY
jgi:gamma-glutamyltranspeptidase/glutathione hydrolase